MVTPSHRARPKRTSMRRWARLLMPVLAALVLLGSCSGARSGKGGGTTVKNPSASKNLQVDTGGCVDWNESDPDATLSAVDCANPHHFEVAGKTNLQGGDYPGDEALNKQADEACAPIVTQYLSHPLDPVGRFEADALLPSEESWKSGDRSVICGVIELEPPDEQNQRDEIKRDGTARGADQTQLAPPGLCLVTRPEGVVLGSCAQPHEYEIVGETNLAQFPPGAPQPPDENFWALGEGPACAPAVAQYLGRPLAPDEHTYARPMPPESWAVGRRRTECVLVKVDGNGQPVAQKAPLKPAKP